MMILTRQHAEILARASGLKVRVDLELVAGEVLIDVVLPGGRARLPFDDRIGAVQERFCLLQT
jgi:hypothetical protein